MTFTTTGDHALSTGRLCRVANPDLPLLPHYHVLYFPESQGPPSEVELDEMVLLSRHLGRSLGQEICGDPEGFTVIFNGARTRRVPTIHIHLLPAASVRAKRFAMLCLLGKTPLRRLRSLARRLMSRL